MTVEVFEGRKRLKFLRKRKIKKLPTKTAGAQYQNLIYPLYQYRSKDPSIDILDKGYFEFACEDWESENKLRCVDDTDDGPHNWSIQSQNGRRFLFFDGTERSLRTVIDEAGRYGLVESEPDGNFAPSHEIFRHDWFIRLDHSRPLDEVRPIVQKIFLANGESSRPDTESVEELAALLPEELLTEFLNAALEDASARSMVSWLGGQVEVARKNETLAREARSKKIERLTAKNAELEFKLDSARNDIKSLKIRHESEIGTIQEEKERLINKLDKETAGTLESYAVEKQLSAITASIESLSKKFEADEKIRSEKEELGIRLEELSQYNEELESRLNSAPEPAARYAPGSKLPSALVVEALRQFSNLLFHYETPEVILSKFTDPSNLFEIFRLLESGQEIPSRTIANAKGWREVNKHIHTGNTSGKASMGRIYLKKEADNKLFVVVHHKRNETEQTRIITRLRDASYFRPLKF